jgi:flagellar motor switch protein FliG
MTTLTSQQKKSSEDRLRKVAILLQSMEPQVADNMLEQFDAQTAAEIRHWLISLPEISAAEEQAVIKEFLGQNGVEHASSDSQQSPAKKSESDGVSLELSGENRVESQSNSISKSATSEKEVREKPFSKLQSAKPEMLVEFLETEHPQVVAVVLSNVAATTAAEVIRNLPQQIRGDVLSRIGRMRDIDRVVLDRIEDELAERLSAKLIEESSEEPGEQTLAAILAAASAEEHATYATELRTHSPVLADRVESRLHGEFQASESSQKNTNLNSVSSTQSEYKGRAERITWQSPSAAFGELIKLDDRTMAGVMASCDPKELIIALAGAEPKLVDRICSRLNRSQARQLRMRIKSPGPLALADVEEAQRRVIARAASILSQRQKQAA